MCAFTQMRNHDKPPTSYLFCSGQQFAFPFFFCAWNAYTPPRGMRMKISEIAPPEVGKGAARIILTGREEVVIEGHKGLFSYETKCIRIRSKSGLVTVSGQDLIIDHLGVQDLLIHGKVEDVAVDGEKA